MLILVIYNNWDFNKRLTFSQSIDCFKKYSKPNHVYYLNVALGIPNYVQKMNFDVIIYHYSILILKWTNPEQNLFNYNLNKLIKLKGYKVAIPQDEYIYSDYICKFFKLHNIKSVFTCLFEEDFEKVYPKEKSGVEYYITVLPGYSDDLEVEKWKNKTKPHIERKFDIGYRARKNPYWLGELGVYKWIITDKFNSIITDLKLNLSNKTKDVLLGNNWINFLNDCRCVLGTESGASLHDPDGTIRKSVDLFIEKNPNATFDEAKKECFPDKDWNINLATLSPRHFEACIMMNCQILIEGKYANILKPNIHYIELKKDWSNINEVINKVKDINYCENIAISAYKEIIESKKYTYSNFVHLIINHCKDKIHNNSKIKLDIKFKLLELNHRFPYFTSPLLFIKFSMWSFVKLVLKVFSLTGKFDSLIYRNKIL